jgi:predicted amidohydrolase
VTNARAIAAAQTTAVPGDVAANLSQHLQLARAAAKACARVLLFPRLSLTGYELELAPSSRSASATRASLRW